MKDHDELPRALRNYRPPRDDWPTDRLPGDPTPEEIRERIWEVQQGWSEETRAARARKATGTQYRVEGTAETPVVRTADVAAAVG